LACRKQRLGKPRPWSRRAGTLAGGGLTHFG
jgi:hypothetical protein